MKAFKPNIFKFFNLSHTVHNNTGKNASVQPVTILMASFVVPVTIMLLFVARYASIPGNILKIIAALASIVFLISALITIATYVSRRDRKLLLPGMLFLILSAKQAFLYFRPAEIRHPLLYLLFIIFGAAGAVCALATAVYLRHIFSHRKRDHRAEYEHKYLAHDLQERVKELQCLYTISHIIDEPGKSLDEVLGRIVQAIPPGFQEPDATCARIIFDQSIYQTDNFKETPHMLSKPIKVQDEVIGSIDVYILSPLQHKEFFLEFEEHLLLVVAERLGKIIERFTTFKQLQDSQKELQEQQENLSRKNQALRELLEQIEFEKKRIKDEVGANVDKLIMPTVKKLILKSDPEERTYLSLLQKNLNDLVSSFGIKINKLEDKLAPREIEICDMIKNGLSTKEISDLLNISATTVDRHRNNIRKKLGLVNQNINLSAYLQQLA